MEIDLDKPYAPEPLDFRFFRYSKLALPLLVLILLTFTTVLCLTMWQARSNIQFLRAGVPRELEPPGNDKEAGMSKHRRNLRLTCSIIGIFCSSAAILVFLSDISPILRAQLNYPLGFILIANLVVAWVTFGLDMNSERDARWCSNSPNETVRCESREDMATVCTVFDALVAVMTMVSGALLVAYTFTGDFAREKIEYGDGRIDTQYYTQPGLIPNGVSTVRKKITLLALIFTLIVSIILLVFAILLHESRNRYVFKDKYNRTTSGSDDTRPGWPLQSTKMRYATCSGVILAVLFNLIPLTSRTIAYILGFLYILLSVMSFVCFGLDLDAIEKAKQMTCPSGFECVYHPYNATIAIEFIGGILLIAYVIWEFFVSKTAKSEEAH